MRSKKNCRRHKRIPKFTKFYHFTNQDEKGIKYTPLLQSIYGEIAKEVFSSKNNIKGDWIIENCGLTLYIDNIFGSQAEITGTSFLPFLKRLRLHIIFLNLIKNGKSIQGALNRCLLI